MVINIMETKIGSGICGDVILKANQAIKKIPLKKISSQPVTRNFGIPYMLELKNIKKYKDNKGTWDPGINDINELILLNQLQHLKFNNQYIVPRLYNFKIIDKKIEIKMEYFNHNLETYILNTNISNYEFKTILYKMWNILKMLNQQGVKHLDTHGRNFLINNDKHIVIIDFGHSITNLFEYSNKHYQQLYENTYIDLAMNILHCCPNYLNKRLRSSAI